MKRAAIVTGASSGIGLAVSAMLVRKDYEVYGIARHFPENDFFDNKAFHAIECDVTETERLCSAVKKIMSEAELYILVNGAGVGYYGLHEELNPLKLKQMVRINLEAPMILAQQTLRQLKKNKGFIINISSVTAQQSNPHGCAYGATKAGLTGFSKSLFDEVRKYGVRVASIQPDMTKTNLYRNADFCEAEEEEARLLPEEVADAVEYIIGSRSGLAVQEITLKPQLHRIRRKNAKQGDDKKIDDKKI